MIIRIPQLVALKKRNKQGLIVIVFTVLSALLVAGCIYRISHVTHPRQLKVMQLDEYDRLFNPPYKLVGNDRTSAKVISIFVEIESLRKVKTNSIKDYLNKNVCSLNQWKSCGAFFGGISRLLGYFNSLAEAASLQPENNKLEEANYGKTQRKPIESFPIISFFGISFGFFFTLWGLDCFDNKRRLFGAALYLIGVVFASFGFFGWWL
jgi:hypothetical protein